MAKKSKEKNKTAQESGVEEFIKRLQNKGVEEGKTRATEIITDAEEQAKSIVEKAEKEAEEIVSKAEKKANKLEKAAKDSIEVAFRDSVLELKNTAEKAFVQELKKIVKKEIANKDVIKEMILKVVEASTSKHEILIADPVKDKESVDSAVYGITKAMLTDKIVLKHFSSPDQQGIIIKKTNKGIEIDLTDKAISDLLSENLLPVYQELLSGEK